MLLELPLLGFDPFFQEQLPDWPSPPLMPARVASAHRDRYEVWAAAGPAPARLAGSTRRQLGDEALPGVGDWVLIEAPEPPGGSAVIRAVLERRTVFLRAAAGRAARAQVVAANVDRVFIVLGLDAGVNLHAIDRYLARIWAGGAQPEVVLNKADLAQDGPGAVAEVENRCPGIQAHLVSAYGGDGVDAIRRSIPPACTVALVGPSGAGKSTLANALLGEERQATGSVRAADARGRHTTTRRELLLLPGGGLLLDTPGMRELEVVDDAGLDTVFEDVAALAARCHFRDCRHTTEPGCAVREAVACGALDAERLEHFRKLQREAAAFQLRQDARKRRQAARLWGQLEREARQLRRWKGGK